MSYNYSGYGGYGGYDNYYNSAGFGGYDPYQDYGGYQSYDGYNDFYGYGAQSNYGAYSANEASEYNPYGRRGREGRRGRRDRHASEDNPYDGYGMGGGYEDHYQDERYAGGMPDTMGGRGVREPPETDYDDEESEFGSNYGERGDSPVPAHADFWGHGSSRLRPLTAENLARVGDADFDMTQDRWVDRQRVFYRS